MQNIEALKELLRMAHEQLDSQKARIEALEQALKVAGISIEALKEQGK
jgi:hypothetical protein